MSYHEMNRMLQQRFAATPNGVANHSQEILLCKEINLILSYPGYKTTSQKMDFRITLDGHPVSHEDIVRDIWEKLDTGVNPEILRNFLLDIAENGIISNAAGYSGIDNGTGYSLDELLHTIAWIALQEDINYPMPRYQGRRMPFARYLEAIHAFNDPDLSRDTVLRRTNVRGAPPAPLNYVDYDVIPHLT